MVTEAKRQANAKYDKSHTRSIMLKLNKTTDADILASLESKGNKQGYIKELVRKDIKRTRRDLDQRGHFLFS